MTVTVVTTQCLVQTMTAVCCDPVSLVLLSPGSELAGLACCSLLFIYFATLGMAAIVEHCMPHYKAGHTMDLCQHHT